MNKCQQATNTSSGAQYYKCALQVNFHDYGETYRGKPSSPSEDQYNTGLVETAKREQISVLAVADHNRVRGLGAVQDKAGEQGIRVFPGFEIKSREGVHVLCLYPLDSSEDQLERFLGELGIRDTGSSTDLSNRHFAELLRTVQEQGGLSIAAHATSADGLLQVLDGQSRMAAWKDPNLLAVQIPGSIGDLPLEYREIVQNRDPQYKREFAVAVVNAQDVEKVETLSEPSASCWIKMSEVSIEGLRQAFLDPDSRIRLHSDPVLEEHAELLTLSWDGGFLNNADIHFNSDLNVIIGGRGTGKSTIVESLRYVIGANPLGADSRKAHNGIIKDVLKDGTKISLKIRTHHPAPKNYQIERTIPAPPVVSNDDGQILPMSPVELLPGIEVYGQHEISELSKDSGKLLHLLDRFMEGDNSIKQQKSETRQKLNKSRQTILSVQSELQQIEEKIDALPGLEEIMERYRKAGLEGRLLEKSQLVREERILKSLSDCLLPFQENLGAIKRELPMDRTFLSEKALNALPSKAILTTANEVLNTLSQELKNLATQMEIALNNANEGITRIWDQWKENAKTIQDRYEKILRELQDSQVDGAEFIRLRKRIEEIRPLRERKTRLLQLVREHEERRRDLLKSWEVLKADELQLLSKSAKKIGKQLQNHVRVAVREAGVRAPLIDILRETVGGRLQEAEDKLTDAEHFSLSKFVGICREGPDALCRHYSFPPNQAKRIADVSAETLMRIEELELPHTAMIELNTADVSEPQWKPIENLSTGQKATAILLILLIQSQAPLVVDQPEDDLDNRFITESVVPKMREGKRKRQFIFSTHNANIPVLGDAELIVGLSPDDKKARIDSGHKGSIDSKSVRNLVEEVLEGGKEAFETRRRKYGF
ncbi:MAG: AAA family ATPase [Gammaproteobacteria bacterium]|nr:AAA family ATPase [Gammaproteobacteria bacterium]